MVSDSDISTILVTDFGSTTTKARLFTKNGGWRLAAVGEHPTTVEDPHKDVTVGLFEALAQIERKTHLKFHDGSKILSDIALATSSAGGGLQVVILAPTRHISGARAEKAAMLSGAIILKTFCLDEISDDREIIQQITTLRPDIIIITGGFESGSSWYEERFAELLLSADPKPRFENQELIPVILAGNSRGCSAAERMLSGKFLCFKVDNVSPDERTEKIDGLLRAVHDIFISHVMSSAPGYQKLLTLLSANPQPTPIAAGLMTQFAASETNAATLCVDIGGATTDIFTCDDHGRNLTRTVAANYGMSYSIPQVIKDAEKAGVLVLSDKAKILLLDKMLRPGLLPITIEQLELEHVIAKAALWMSLEKHKLFCGSGYKRPDLVIGSGGVLSHCPSLESASEILIDGFGLTGLCELVVDNLFLLPHLGILSEHHPDAAKSLFLRECVKPLSVLVRPEWQIGWNKRVLAKVVVNDRFEFELIQGMRMFVRIPEDVLTVSVKPRLGCKFSQTSIQAKFSGVRLICLDGTSPIGKVFKYPAL